jgi:hypothetical protein
MKILTIGRDSKNQIILNDNYVSRQHAQLIIMDNGEVLLKDLGSSNGTYVNGNNIIECYLKVGDIVKCGPVFLNWTQYVNISPSLEHTSLHNIQNQSPFEKKLPQNIGKATSKLYTVIFAVFGAILGIPLSYYFQSSIVQAKVGGIGGYLENFGDIVSDSDLLINVILSVLIFTLIGGIIGFIIDKIKVAKTL